MPQSTRSIRSGMISPVSAFSMLSEVSNVESVSSSRSSRRGSTTGSVVSRTRPPTHPEFAYTDAQIELWTSDSLFLVHEFQLNKFSRWATRIQEARQRPSTDTRLKIASSQKSEDIRNTLVVIYTFVGSRRRTPLFDSDVLVSTLKIASRYKYPELRQYAIDELEQSHNLPVIQRIQLSSDFSIPEWEISSLAELCRRREPISLEEGEILGIRRLVDISRIREEEQMRSSAQSVNREVGTHELLNPDGTVRRERFSDTAEYTVRYARLPDCDCRAVRSSRARSDDSGTESQRPTRRHPRTTSGQQSSSVSLSVIPCQTHEIAPRILAESRALYSQRNELVERLGRVKRVVETAQNGRQGASVEDALMETSWVHRSS